jgi:hypothetical protein
LPATANATICQFFEGAHISVHSEDKERDSILTKVQKYSLPTAQRFLVFVSNWQKNR